MCPMLLSAYRTTDLTDDTTDHTDPATSAPPEVDAGKGSVTSVQISVISGSESPLTAAEKAGRRGKKPVRVAPMCPML